MCIYTVTPRPSGSENCDRNFQSRGRSRQVSSVEVWLSAALHGRVMSLNVLRARGYVWMGGSRRQLGLCHKAPEASAPWTVHAGAKLSPGRTVSSTMLESEHCLIPKLLPPGLLEEPRAPTSQETETPEGWIPRSSLHIAVPRSLGGKSGSLAGRVPQP